MAFERMFSLCTVCNVLCDIDSVICVYCKKWFHIKCTSLSTSKSQLLNNSDVTYHCSMCTVSQYAGISHNINPNEILPDEFSSDCRYYVGNIQHFSIMLQECTSIVHINIRSLAKNLPLSEAFICQLNHSPDIIAISETTLRSTTPANFGYNVNIYGYNFVHANTETNAGGFGFYIKEGVDFNILPNFGIYSSDCENLWIEVKLHNTECAIGVVYRHPAPNHKEFDEKLFKVVDNLNNNKYTYFICGDFNINLMKYSRDNTVTEYVDVLHSLSCKALISKPTRITEQSSALIDHIYK